MEIMKLKMIVLWKDLSSTREWEDYSVTTVKDHVLVSATKIMLMKELRT
jgi:hypothetical protein